jgi:arabinogalactan oligomer/maltooligosaccharide transport system substrate-binding protein
MGKIPALKDQYIPRITGLAQDVRTEAFLVQTQRSDAMPSFPAMNSWWAAAQDMFESVWEGLLSPADAARKAQEDYDELRRLAGE